MMLVTTASFAWFSLNRTVTANNMYVKARAESSIVISSDRTNLGTSSYVNFRTTLLELIPCTHDEGFTSGLKQLTFPAIENVDAGSGMKSFGDFTSDDFVDARAISDSNITEIPNGGYANYIDFIIFIASKGMELDNQDLIVTISSDKLPADVKDTWKATSVDFYYQSTNGSGIGTYQGTLNLAGYDYATNNQTALTSFRISDIDIPFAEDYDGTVETGSSKVTMRVYFDGALQSSPGQCFVNTNTAKTTGIGVIASFNAEPHTP